MKVYTLSEDGRLLRGPGFLSERVAWIAAHAHGYDVETLSVGDDIAALNDLDLSDETMARANVAWRLWLAENNDE